MFSKEAVPKDKLGSLLTIECCICVLEEINEFVFHEILRNIVNAIEYLNIES